ncbi:MAG: DUF5615 family PIN-like protein [Bacteroidota bacterium]
MSQPPCRAWRELGVGRQSVPPCRAWRERGDETPDMEITEYADRENLIVVTKDFDFYHSYMALERPKKLFLITTGNLKNRQLFDLFRNNSLIIKNALERSTFIELSNDGITEHK